MIGGARLALLYLVLMLVLAIAGGKIAPYDPFALSQEALSPPNGRHFMGTDNIGRDIFSGILVGSTTALTVGFFTAVVAALLGVVIGALSGYVGGFADLVLMRVAEFFQDRKSVV